MKYKLPNKFDCFEEVSFIYLENRKGEIIEKATIDTNCFDFLKQYRWNLIGNGYAGTHLPNGKRESMHKMLMPLIKKGIVVDHINRNPLDNRMCNLRYITHAGNIRNQKAKGVYKRTNGTERWSSWVYVNKKQIYLGDFNSYEEGKKVRDKFLAKVLEEDSIMATGGFEVL